MMKREPIADLEETPGMRPLRTAGVLLFLLIFLVSAQGCAIKKGHTELGPIYYKRPLPENQGTESALLWPFFQKYSSTTVKQFAFRPLLNYRIEETDGPNGNVTEMQSAWPLFLHRKTQGLTLSRTRVYPLFFHRHFRHPEGDDDVDTFLLPFLLTGNSGSQGKYFALFPFAGELKGIFGADRIRFLLFPLYAESRSKEHRSWHILWPFIKYGKGGGKSSFRIFPFVGWKEKENWNKKLFVLWPFFVRAQEWLGTEHPTDSWFFLPFYGRQRTPFGKIHYFLYPFFSYQRSENPGNRYREWQIPWPFFRMIRGDNFRQTYFWPFWGKYTHKDRYHKDFALYPIYWFYAFGTRETITTRRYVLPFYWDRRVMDHSGQGIRKRIKVWPFLDRTKDVNGKSSLSFLSPLWFRDKNGFERNYGDFWTLYHGERDPDGRTDQRILWYRWYGSDPAQSAATGTGTSTKANPGEEDIPGPHPQSPGEDLLGETPWIKELIKPFKEVEGSVP